MVETTTRTIITKPRNQRQVNRLVEPASYDASKLWNCGLYQLYEWNGNQNLPSGDLDYALKEQLKENKRYAWNFAEKVCTNKEYRQESRKDNTDWARTANLYETYSRRLYNVLSEDDRTDFPIMNEESDYGQVTHE